MVLAMLDVIVGKSILSFLYPTKAPTNVKGIEMQHHMAATLRTSKKGTDADEWWKAKTVLKKMKMANESPGKRVAVMMVHIW